ncbi:hypothetical protein ACWEPC_15640 [Nonomuraea sp. NPDC004297]
MRNACEAGLRRLGVDHIELTGPEPAALDLIAARVRGERMPLPPDLG